MNPIAEIFDQLIRYMLPAILVFFTAFIMLKRFVDFEKQKRMHELKLANQNQALPFKLQAYERITLLMERITPNNLLLRLKNNSITAGDLHLKILTEIRAEFDHNVTQQIYVSPELWATIVKAKEETIKLINICAAKVPKEVSGLELNKVIFDTVIKLEILPTERAIQEIQQEIKELI